MAAYLAYTMIYAGALLMAYNIYRYLRFARTLTSMAGWEQEQRIIRIPTLLLVMFLFGYLGIALFSHPGLMIAFVLFGGSVFVFIMIVFVEHVAVRIQENERMAGELLAAEESNRAKTSFLSTMSHEIRTPLNAIIGLNKLALTDPDLSEVTRDRLVKMQSSANHLLALINDVLDMSRIESGHTSLDNRVFGLQKLLGQVNDIMSAQCAVKELSYRSEVVGTLDARYLGDDVKLKQVLINILGNSVKFTHAPGTVSLTAEQVAAFEGYRTLRFTIADTGIGMDESFIPKLFSVFTQEDGASTNEFGGTGLGMAITKNLVDMMNGDIQVQSKKGVGSTFTVTVTLMEAPEASEDEEDYDTLLAEVMDEVAALPTEDDNAAAKASLDDLHVLIAEDIEINAEILIDLLDMEGIEAEHAHNGQEAVTLFEGNHAGHFDAILMDLRMPVMDGLDATKTIRELGRPDAQTIPIIALTANAFDEDVQRSLQMGMNAHLTKPIDPNQLFETLADLTGRVNEA